MAKAIQVVKKNRENLVNKIITNMEKGYIFQNSQWNSNLLKPHNPYSNIFYSGANRFILLFQQDLMNYQDSRWLTFKQIEKINSEMKETDKTLKIKKGEKGTLLEKWIWKKEEIINDGENEVKKTIELSVPIVNYFYVFNGEQIENMPELEVGKMEESDITITADRFIKSSLCPIKEKMQERSFYNPQDDEIVLPPRGSFKNDKAFLGVLLHEMAHSTGYENRLNRKIRNLFGTKDYAKEELRAELSSYFLLADLGISDCETIQDNSNYLKSWIQVLKNDANELFKASNEAELISKFLIENYEKVEENMINIDEEKNNNDLYMLLVEKLFKYIINTADMGQWFDEIKDNEDDLYRSISYDLLNNPKILVNKLNEDIENWEDKGEIEFRKCYGNDTPFPSELLKEIQSFMILGKENEKFESVTHYLGEER